jgi:type II restriction/modification system DNA methylase subunit YeeA
MTPAEFIRKWGDSRLRERQGSQEHFIDLCRLLGEPTPAEADPFGETYCFERGAEKTGGGDGWADVWRKGCFAWEYKGKHKDLNAALRQVQTYALDLQNPPYLVVSDMERIVVHTNWTNTVSQRHEFQPNDLLEPARLEMLRQVFQGSERLKPGVSPQELTATVALRFGELGKRLQERGHPPRMVAHFLNQLVFCMFAEDAGLLPDGLFTRTIKATQMRPGVAQAQLADLFTKMATEAEDERFFGPELIRWFNGGLFDRAETLPLTVQDLKLISDTAAENDWSEIDPAIFGTLFEQALTATRERPALGAHYTDREKILKIVDPVIIRPLTAEREAVQTVILGHAAEMKAADAERAAVLERAAEALRADPAAARADEPKRRKELAAIAKRRDAAYGAAEDALKTFLDRLSRFRVLDPACGSGNFLYVALQALKDIELRTILDAERAGITAPMPRVGLDAVMGIEIEPYAAELARVTLWIGDLQWMKRNGYTNYREPILSSLTQIECRDALITRVEDGEGGRDASFETRPAAAPQDEEGGLGRPDEDGGLADSAGRSPTQGPHPEERSASSRSADGLGVSKDARSVRWVEATWPKADVIIGNPPFLGGKKKTTELGDNYVSQLSKVFGERVARDADFVVYWVDKGWQSFLRQEATRVGLVTTNSVRGGSNRKVLDRIADDDALWECWSDEPWILDGAAVRVSMLGFGAGFREKRLDGVLVSTINADLTSEAADLTKATRLTENTRVAFNGIQKTGPFEVSGDQARNWLNSPTNPNGMKNAHVLRPYWNGLDVTRRPRDSWIVDFTGLTEAEAASFEAPFQHALLHVQPTRRNSKVQNAAAKQALISRWWLFWRERPELMEARRCFSRVAASPEVSKHRVFVWVKASIGIDKNLIAIARDDDTSFGILHSRFHELWSLRMGTWLGVGNDPRYTPSTTFETFPFPEGLTPNIPAADYAGDPRGIAIAAAAARLNALRENWLNPADLTMRVPEVVPGYPDRILPKDEAAAAILKKRTLTNLYNERPAWLAMAHKALDDAVADAYGWPRDLSDEQVLEHLFTLNQARAKAEAEAAPVKKAKRAKGDA